MKDFDMKITGQRIRELRQDKKLSQVKLAELIGAAQNTIAQYENGTAKASIEIIFKLTIILETTSDYLLGLTEY